MDSYQPLGSGANYTGAGWNNADGKTYVGVGAKLRSYDFVTNTAGPIFKVPNLSGITGMDFSSGDLYVTTNAEKLRRVDWASKTLVAGWTFDLTPFQVRDSRAVDLIDDRFYVLDGYDGRSNGDPLRHAVFVFDVLLIREQWLCLDEHPVTYPREMDLAGFIAVATLVVVTPGPDMTLVARNTFAGGRPAGLATSAGTCSGLLVHATAAALGLSAVLLASSQAFTVVKIAGAAYRSSSGCAPSSEPAEKRPSETERRRPDRGPPIDKGSSPTSSIPRWRSSSSRCCRSSFNRGRASPGDCWCSPGSSS